MNSEKPLNTRDVDVIEEFRLRRWAREHHVPPSQRERDWHPVVHDEMNHKDSESLEHKLSR